MGVFSLWETASSQAEAALSIQPVSVTADHCSLPGITVRLDIETVNGQLSGQFAIAKNYAHSFWGLCTRLYSKLTAHTLCIYIKRLLGKPDFLQIKALAFPNQHITLVQIQ